MIAPMITEQPVRQHASILEGDLNERQKQAVSHIEGPLLVISGAGTGKTKVLTSRISHLLMHQHAFPSQILAVTFTNKAAREMTDRIRAQAGHLSEGLWIGTFHSIAAKILRANAEIVGLRSNFTIIDSDDQTRLIKQIMAELEIDVKETPPKNALGIIQGFKDKAITPDKVTMNMVPLHVASGRILEIYQQYQERLLRANAVDFGDLLLYNLAIFNHSQDRLQFYQQKFRFILVDEYQDTNIAQYLWLRLLAQQSRNICCVGDDDQSIYGWRGAEVGNILKFSKDFAGAKVIRLEQNYRSTSSILAVASGIIANNSERLGKTLWTESEGGSLVKLSKYNSNFDEAKGIVREIEDLVVKQSVNHSDIAILVRAAYQTRNFESELVNAGVAYRVVGGVRFYERKEIKDIIAYLRVVIQPDDDLAFERIINTPKRGIGQTTLQKIFKIASEQNISLFKAAVGLCNTKAFSPSIREKVTILTDNFLKWGKMRNQIHHTALTRLISEESGYMRMLEAENTVEADGRIENIRELIGALEDFDSIAAFLEHISLVTDGDDKEKQNLVSIMTLHAAKGLEFCYVFLPGWDEGIFPNQRVIDDSGHKGLEEERRLAYVGVTRAREHLMISHTLSRMQFGDVQTSIPSRFLQEMPEEYVEKIDHTYQHHFNNSYQSYGNKRKSGYQRYLEKKQEAASGFGTYQQDDYSGKSTSKGFELDQRVTHQKFGKGTVVSVEGDVVQVIFDQHGVKKLKEQFLESAYN